MSEPKPPMDAENLPLEGRPTEPRLPLLLRAAVIGAWRAELDPGEGLPETPER